jgi:hypothetical protein
VATGLNPASQVLQTELVSTFSPVLLACSSADQAVQAFSTLCKLVPVWIGRCSLAGRTTAFTHTVFLVFLAVCKRLQHGKNNKHASMPDAERGMRSRTLQFVECESRKILVFDLGGSLSRIRIARAPDFFTRLFGIIVAK